MALYPPARLLLAAAFAALGTCACADHPAGNTAAADSITQAGCLSTGDGSLEAQLRGALVADLAWQNNQMQCEGGARPDGDGIRVTIAGPLSAGKPLRFIFGIDLHDTAAAWRRPCPPTSP